MAWPQNEMCRKKVINMTLELFLRKLRSINSTFKFSVGVGRERDRIKHYLFDAVGWMLFILFVFYNAQRKLNNGMCKLSGSLAILAFQRRCPHRHVSQPPPSVEYNDGTAP